MPVYVAVECPDACRFLVSKDRWEGMGGEGILIWIICYEAKGYVSACINFDNVTTYRCRWGINGCSTVDAGAGGGALYNLEIVAV